MTKPITILCFTDVLCGLCYVGEARLEQLRADFAGQVELSYHFISVYGDVHRRIAKRGMSYGAYSALVRDGLSRYEHVEAHPELFARDVPTSCVPAHLYLRAVELLEDQGVVTTSSDGSVLERLMWQLRVAFFRDLRDISNRRVLDEIAGEQGIPVNLVAKVIDDGSAFAELSRDGQLQGQYSVTVAPSLVLNDGRQLLYGNVGYRVIEANIRELLSPRAGIPSWC